MALKAKELRQKAGKIHAQMNEILTRSTDKMTSEDETKWNSLDTEYEGLMKQATMLEKHEQREIEETEAEEVKPNVKAKKIGDLTPEERGKAEGIALRAFMQGGTVPKELHEIMTPGAKEKDDDEMITKALNDLGLVRATQTTTTTGGGYTIPRGFQAELEKALLEYGGMWESSRIIRTRKGNVIDWPTVNDTANKAYLLAESVSAATSAQAVVFGQQQFEAYKYTSGLIQVPTELLEDSEFDIASELKSMLVERIWRGTNEAFTIADGTNKPKGITLGAVYGGSTSNDSALIYDDFVNLEHSVDPAYRRAPGAKFMFHDSVLKEVKKIKDLEGRPIWNFEMMKQGEPGSILGYKYTINQDMASFASGSTTANDGDKAMLFGDLRKYIIRQVRDMRIVRLDERYGELDQTAFVVFFRVDGDLLNAGTNPVKYLKMATT